MLISLNSKTVLNQYTPLKLKFVQISVSIIINK